MNLHETMNMNNYTLGISATFDQNHLYIQENGLNKIIDLTYKISKIEKFDESLVVLIDPPKNTIFNENIYGILYDGKILWQIKFIPHVHEDSPYMGMNKDEKNIKLYN